MKLNKMLGKDLLEDMNVIFNYVVTQNIVSSCVSESCQNFCQGEKQIWCRNLIPHRIVT